jgi:signal transduction histidine kinase
VGASLIEHDIAERNRAQSARLAQERHQQEVFHLKELARMRSEFMGRAAHELNTPLTPVLLQIQALKDIPHLDAKQVLGLAAIERNVLRLASLVKDLLMAADLGSRELTLNPSHIDLREIVLDALGSMHAEAHKKGIALQTKTMGLAPVPAYADHDRVIQVLFNVIENALKFTPEGGSITVEAIEHDDGSVVTVTDTGLGFAEDGRERLFRPFGRLHEDIPGTPTGTGLGLFISKGIVDESGGEIWAESPGPGKGATVGFKLPRKPVPRPGRGIVAAHGFEESVTTAPDPVAALAAPPVPPSDSTFAPKP